jgi:hypothetical protein
MVEIASLPNCDGAYCWHSEVAGLRNQESPIMAALINAYAVRDHFTTREPSVKATYEAILKAAKQLGPVKEEAKKTSIHLVRKSAFAGIATRRSALILTLKAKTDLPSQRIVRREQVSSSRWHLEVRVESPEAVDAELKRWLKSAYELSG